MTRAASFCIRRPARMLDWMTVPELCRMDVVVVEHVVYGSTVKIQNLRA